MSIAPCPPSSAPPRGVVEFDPAVFKAAFPSFSTVADAALTLSFSLATLQLNNSCGSLVCDAAVRESLLNLLVAHITALNDGENGNPPQGMVGRISSATEGTVKADADMGEMVIGQAYYMQTQWGALYWQSTASFRQARYIPAPPTCADIPNGIGYPFWPSGPSFGGGGGCGC